jgi:hypothetical protein
MTHLYGPAVRRKNFHRLSAQQLRLQIGGVRPSGNAACGLPGITRRKSSLRRREQDAQLNFFNSIDLRMTARNGSLERWASIRAN